MIFVATFDSFFASICDYSTGYDEIEFEHSLDRFVMLHSDLNRFRNEYNEIRNKIATCNCTQ